MGVAQSEIGGRTRHDRLASAALLAALAGGLFAGAARALPPVPTPPGNPITEPKRVLGKILFFDEQMSTSNTVSCATCHGLGTAGTDGRPRVAAPGLDGVLGTPDDVFGSRGVVRADADNDVLRDGVFGTGTQITGRAANPVINAAFAPQLFWDGRAGPQFVDPQTGLVALQANAALEAQAAGPPVSGVEMAHDGLNWDAVADKIGRVKPLDLATNHPPDVAAVISGGATYPDLFAAAFGDSTITASRIVMAIATYERTLISDQTPFDRFRAGQANAMTPNQVQGFNLFQQRSCSVCHGLANDQLTGFGFRNVGLRPIAEDIGRQGVTGNPADAGRFKVPALRNVGLKTSFMHNGQFTNLPDVIRFYARAPGAAPQFPQNQDPVMNAVPPIPPQAAGQIQDFLQNALTDPRVAARQFPFDEPTLFAQRAADRTTSLGGGVAGAGGLIPLTLILEPSMIGNLGYRLGVDRALGGSSATLRVSLSPPVNGRVVNFASAGAVALGGAGVGQGLGTIHWPLHAGDFAPGTIVFAQWAVNDAGAPGGVALSDVVRIPMFCGSSGCPQCNPDVNGDGLVDQDDVDALINTVAGGSTLASGDPDFNHDGNIDQGDVDALITVVAGGECP